jgi:hypothetical protein
MAQAVSVQGDRAAALRLHRVGTAAQAQAPTMAKLGHDAARRVTGIPSDTGTLAKSIEVIASGDWGYVLGSKVPYARYVFRGTKYVDARPPRIPGDIQRRAANAIGDDITRPR